jgi:hypothetical protein
VKADMSGAMAQLLRVAVFAFILIQFLRRIFKARTQGKVPPAATRPARGRKNDFRDVPPPPENPELG